jgi:mRNA interferase YafQ
LKAIKTTNQFLRDLKLARKRGKDLGKIESVIDTLAHGNKLAPKHRPHRLRGDMKGLWECHIEPDWLLIWDETDEAIILIRSGTHADLLD